MDDFYQTSSPQSQTCKQYVIKLVLGSSKFRNILGTRCEGVFGVHEKWLEYIKIPTNGKIFRYLLTALCRKRGMGELVIGGNEYGVFCGGIMVLRESRGVYSARTRITIRIRGK